MTKEKYFCSSTNSNFINNFYLQQISKSQKGNLVTCPLSAHAVLSMAALGAGGQTAHEMKKSLQLPNDDTLAKNGLKTFIAGLDVSYFFTNIVCQVIKFFIFFHS